ncbi:MAG TPA: type II toxin-antitoxin system RelE/ParE family toxin [Pyrinomonadaceae bacterium]|jgi:plasmid stabilization system protein ParE
MYEIVIHEGADEDLRAAAEFYESREPDLGQQFLDELSDVFQHLTNRPFSYSILFDDYRRCLMNRFPYGVVYRVAEQQVLIFAVAHVRRRPRFWKERTQT